VDRTELSCVNYSLAFLLGGRVGQACFFVEAVELYNGQVEIDNQEVSIADFGSEFIHVEHLLTRSSGIVLEIFFQKLVLPGSPRFSSLSQNLILFAQKLEDIQLAQWLVFRKPDILNHGLLQGLIERLSPVSISGYLVYQWIKNHRPHLGLGIEQINFVNQI